MIQNHKIIFIGACGSGNTTFLHRTKTGEFTKKYDPTDLNIVNIDFNTNRGLITLNCYDIGCQNYYNDVHGVHYNGAEGVVMMFDLTSKLSYQTLINKYEKVREICGDIPIIICGNKCDSKDRKVKPIDINFPRQHNLLYFDVSAKTNYNLEKPYLHIMRKLYDIDLDFNHIPLLPPEVTGVEINVIVK